MISRLSRDLERIEFKRFLLKAKGIGFFPNHKRPRVIYIGVDEGKEKVSELAQIIEGITSKLGFPRETRRFKPHITIARIKKPFPPPPVNILTKFGEKINEYVEINQIKLKKSTLTPTGPIYEDLYVKDLKG
ncbi:RNA 2',3'-cyclic phosphodiesterase [Candidatus Geothermarchaeota archaeon]|nr:MAG: RNA 2',3'-cyclic phosphodiesterase [Candidatus Geothermarchaeota archaeon]